MAQADSIWQEHYEYLRLNVLNNDIQEHVIGMRIVVHTAGRREGGNASNNHTTVYLLVQGNRSVQLNMTHTPDDVNGLLDINSRDYRTSRTEIIHFPPTATNELQGKSAEIASEFTIGQAIGALRNTFLQDFTFTGGGMGCRYWVIVLTALFEQQGWLQIGTTLSLHEFLSYQRSTRQGPQHFVMQQGSFDEERTQSIADGFWDRLIRSVNQQLSYWQSRGNDGRARINLLERQMRALIMSRDQGARLVQERQDE